MKSNRKNEIIGMLCSCCSECSPDDYFEDLKRSGQKLKAEKSFIEMANFGSAISSVERLILLNALKEKDKCVCELEVILNKSQSTISHHLRKLELAGLVKGYKNGNYTYYHLEKEKFDYYVLWLDNQF